jgi:CheY-like chemotaxis protein
MSETPTALLVEDDPNDAFFIREAFDRTHADVRLVIVSNGLEAVQYLKGQQPYLDRAVFPWPKLVLLDLRLPGLTGFQVLRWIRQQSSQKKIPVVVLTDSLEETDREHAQLMGANDFVVKPCSLNQFVPAVVQICDRWIGQPVRERTLPLYGWMSDAHKQAA